MEYFNRVLETFYTEDFFFLDILMLMCILDGVIGSISALQQHRFNTYKSISGLLTKFKMIISVLLLMVLDILVNVNLISFVPKEIIKLFPFDIIGISDLFAIIYIFNEILSVFKNMYLSNMPIPKGVRNMIEDILKRMTEDRPENEPSLECKFETRKYERNYDDEIKKKESTEDTPVSKKEDTDKR